MMATFFMRRMVCALGYCAVLLPGWCIARPVTPAEAQAAAQAWLAENPQLATSSDAAGNANISAQARLSATDAVEVVTREADGKALFYLVQQGNERWLAVANDTRLEPVVAMAEGSPETAGPFLDILQADFAARHAALAAEQATTQLASIDAAELTPPERRWAHLLGSTPQGGLYSTEIADTPERQFAFIRGWKREQLTHWAQNETNNYIVPSTTSKSNTQYVYNYYTPGHYPCGCVATAAAAVLEFLRVPAGPSGVTNSCKYNDKSYFYETKGGAYDWDLLPTWQRNNTTLTLAQRELLGRVTYDLGVLLGMNWMPGASSAFTYNLAPVFAKHFGLTSTRYAMDIEASTYGPLIYAPILCGRPVILSISGTAGGHAVVAVGYAETTQGTAYTRIFMGYGGSSDGWYALPNISPSSVTSYTTVNGAITMIGGDDAPCIPVYGRVTSADGTPAAFVSVSLLGHTVATTPFGTFAMLLKPSEIPIVQPLTLTVGDTTHTLSSTDPETGETTDFLYVGLPAEISGKSSATALANALPPEQHITLPATTATLKVRTLPHAARNVANREGKLILLLTGPSEDADSIALQTSLAQQAATLNKNVILCLCDETLAFTWWQAPEIRLGLFDPGLFVATNSWEENAPALIDTVSTPTRLSSLVSNSHTLSIAGESKRIPAAWLAKHFPGAATHELPTLATTDSDGDGFTNAQEYILGTDPANPASAFRIIALERGTDGLIRPTYEAVTKRKYTLQGKASLNDAWGEITAESRFFRVSIDLP